MENITFVTGLWDIGRGDLDNTISNHDWNRGFQTYIARLEELLSTGLNIIVFGEESIKSITDRYKNSRFILYNKEEFSRDLIWYDRIQELRTSKTWYDQPTAQWLKSSPQALLPLYIPITLNKLFFLEKATKVNPFSSKRFYWLDAGITKNHEVTLLRNMIPDLLKHHKFMFLSHLYRDNTEVHGFLRDGLHKYCSLLFVERIMKGFFFGGDIERIGEIIDLYRRIINTSLNEGYLGTEESYFTIMVHQVPELFDKIIIYDCGNTMLAFKSLKIQTLGAFYQSYKNPYSFMRTIQSFKLYYPESNCVVISDGGYDYSNYCSKLNIMYEYDTNISCNNSLGGNYFYRPGAIRYLKRFYNALNKIQESHVIILEDDVRILRKCTKPFNNTINGWNIKNGYDHRITQVINRSGYKGRLVAGAFGGCIIDKSFFLNIPFCKIEELLLSLDDNVSLASDNILSFIVLYFGGTIGDYCELTETFYSDWLKRVKDNEIAIVHQYKDDYNKELSILDTVELYGK